ncbi:MAG: glycine cleavage system protein GcvH [Candidatus Zixiibacteriota bacterium]
MDIPSELKYTNEHEWLRADGNVAVAGITDYAQGELGDIVFVELPAVGTDVKAGAPFGTIEAVKAVSDLLSPVSGKIIEINNDLEDNPTAVNTDPYNEGWMVKIKMSNPSEMDELLSAEEYQNLVG